VSGDFHRMGGGLGVDRPPLVKRGMLEHGGRLEGAL